MPCPSTSTKLFCASQNFLIDTKQFSRRTRHNLASISQIFIAVMGFLKICLTYFRSWRASTFSHGGKSTSPPSRDVGRFETGHAVYEAPTWGYTWWFTPASASYPPHGHRPRWIRDQKRGWSGPNCRYKLEYFYYCLFVFTVWPTTTEWIDGFSVMKFLALVFDMNCKFLLSTAAMITLLLSSRVRADIKADLFVVVFDISAKYFWNL